VTALGPSLGAAVDGARVVGTSPTQQAVLLAPHLQELTTLGGQALGVEGHVVVGTAQVLYRDEGDAQFFRRSAFRYDTRTGQLVDLGVLPDPSAESVAYSVNRWQRAAGQAMDAQFQTQPVVFPRQGPPLALATLGGPTGFAFSISDPGCVVGASETAAGALHATLWPPMGPPVDLTPGDDVVSVAYSVNRFCRSVGVSQSQPLRWSPSGVATPLPLLPGAFSGEARSINDLGTMVGFVSFPSDDPDLPEDHAVLWTRQGALVDLATVVPPVEGQRLQMAVSIDEEGHILVLGTLGGSAQTFLLRPAPHPALAHGHLLAHR
jgi:uncharacterized membrane protein